MGSINSRVLTTSKLLRLPSPILLCVNRPDFDKAISDAGFHEMSLNFPLAKELSGKTEKEISASIMSTVSRLLPKCEKIYLTDYEMLFDPRYELDVIKLFCEISRHKKLIVQWCGSSNENFLTYAELGYDDYAKYKISDYQIVCVI